MKQPTVVVTGGGTGGHIFPAIAIAQTLMARRPDVAVHFVGGSAGMEMQMVPKAGIPTHGITIAGLQRQLSLRNVWRNLQLPWKMLQGWWQARSLMMQLKPAVVVGTGGYASMPMLYAAHRSGTPIILTEQNAFPGLVNRWMAHRAARILLGNADAAEHFGPNRSKCLFTGNPVRPNLSGVSRQAARERLGLQAQHKVLLVIGGSLGARTLNQALAASLDQLAAAEVQVIWQCGRLYHAQYLPLVQRFPNVRLHAFLDGMADAYAAADLVVSRAGALSISELLQLNKVSILVPSPNVADDHQTHNALSMVHAGAARLIPDAEAMDRLLPEVLLLFQHPATMGALQAGVAAMPKPDGANKIVDVLIPYLPAA